MSKHNRSDKRNQPHRLAGLQKYQTASRFGAIAFFLFILNASDFVFAGPLEQKLIDAAFMGKV